MRLLRLASSWATTRSRCWRRHTPLAQWLVSDRPAALAVHTSSSMWGLIESTGRPEKIRVAVLDDYQNVAESCADWESLGCDVTFIRRHLEPSSEVIEAPEGFNVAVAMRERTSFGATAFGNVPDLESRCAALGRQVRRLLTSSRSVSGFRTVRVDSSGLPSSRR